MATVRLATAASALTLAVWASFTIYEGKIHAVEAFMKTIPVGLGSR